MYDVLIVGAGLTGATIAYELNKKNKKCLVIDKRSHIGGNCYCEKINNINVHKYGAHIFHTNNKKIWNYINEFTNFNNFINTPIANYKNELYNLPFNMNTFVKLWDDVKTPTDAQRKIEVQKKEIKNKVPINLEQQAISLVGKDVYFKLIKEYTEKQWGRDCKELPSFIIKRLPVRFTYNNNYFSDYFQGIPEDGYNIIIKKMLANVEVRLNEDFFKKRDEYENIAKKIIFTGMIDEFFNYQLGKLEYRSLKFEHEIFKDIDNYQGVAVMNFTSHDVKYTRIIEHKHFEFNDCKGTIITKEYPIEFKKGNEAFYPINDDKNNEIYLKYEALSNKYNNIIFAGRLGKYKYYNMDEAIENAIKIAKEIN